MRPKRDAGHVPVVESRHMDGAGREPASLEAERCGSPFLFDRVKKLACAPSRGHHRACVPFAADVTKEETLAARWRWLGRAGAALISCTTMSGSASGVATS